MKKLLYLLLVGPFALFGQSTSYIEQDVPLELAEGWNMFGYSCYEPIDVAISFTSIEDKIVIVKDNSGNVYCQNPDGSILFFDQLSGSWGPLDNQN